MLEKVEARRTSRDWITAPADFARDAVRGLYRDHLVDHFPRRTVVRARIAASKAETFEELAQAVKDARFEHERRVGIAIDHPREADKPAHLVDRLNLTHGPGR